MTDFDQLNAELDRWYNHPALQPMHPVVKVWTFLGGIALCCAVQFTVTGHPLKVTVALWLLALGGCFPVLMRSLARHNIRRRADQILEEIRRD